MIRDLRTVLWKERHAALHQQGGRSRFVITLLTPLVFAVLLPWQMGPNFFVDRVIPTAIAMVMPIVMVALTIPASFAGEREQNTLETLLASRLPDRAILFGKMAFGLLLGWGMAALVLLLGAVVVNVVHWRGAPAFFAWRDLLTYLAISLLMAALVAATGVLVSLRAPTVQDAAQRLMTLFLIPGILLQVAGLLFIDRFRELGPQLNGDTILEGLLLALLLLALATTVLAMRRFRRARLIYL